MPGRSPFQLGLGGLPWRSLGFGLAAAVIFVISASTRLEAQGLYYDELHQATASFAYLGKHPVAFVQLQIGDIPIMNMNYSGAIKTAVYGLYMRWSGADFAVLSWRLLGILILAAGILISAIILGRRLAPFALAVFLFLLVTDTSVLMMTRHDWGPVALALAIRLVLIAAWISGELSGSPTARNSGVLGGLVAISLFEKLSNVLLVIPLLLMLVLSPERRKFRHLGATALGLVLGAIPLVLANLYSLASHGYLISLQFLINSNQLYTPGALIRFLGEYLSLGAGDLVRTFILGANQHYYGRVELALLPAAILGLAAGAAFLPLAPNRLRIAGVLLLCYVSIALGWFLFPQRTWAHHWIIGTPFQYAAVAVLASGLTVKQPGHLLVSRLSIQRAAPLLLLPLLVLRLLGFVWLQQTLIRGDASQAWDPSLTRIGEFAAARSQEAVFILPDWGIGNQMLCFLNGSPGILHYVSWNAASIREIQAFVAQSGRSEFYLVFADPPHFVPLELRSRIIQEVDTAFAGEWRRQPLEEDLLGLRSVVVVKYGK